MANQIPSHTFTKIHLKALHTNKFKILLFSFLSAFISLTAQSQIAKDSLTINSNNSIVNSESTIQENDSIPSDSLQLKSGINSKVTYKAKDEVSLKNRLKKIFMKNEAEVYYEDMQISSGVIELNYGTDRVNAGRLIDTSGNFEQNPVFKQGQNVVEPDSIIFNTVSKKALIFNSKTEQSGGTVIANTTKKENDSVYFIRKGKFTTSENLDDPEYYILMRKAKIVPNKKVVTGFSNMYIYDVPTPIALPFAYFPLTNTRKSGVIFPSFGEANSDRGYAVQNGGYYLVINDNFDLALMGDIYTNGSFGFRAENTYAVRYKYRGNLSFRFESLISSEKGFPDYSKSKIYNLRWSHSKDGKSNPGSRFSASVNLGSSNYYQESINQLNVSNFLNNTLASSISYSKTFQGEPQVNLSVTASHSQNTNTEQITMSLPTFQGSMGRIFPFAPKTGSKKGIIQNVNFQYNMRAENRIQTTDSLFFKSEMFETAKIGARHSIPLSTNFKLFKHLSFTASTNFEENWTMNTVKKYYDQENNVVITEDLNKFDRFNTYNFSTSLGTTVYGMFPFKNADNNPKIQAIRHVMRPSISYSINPSFERYYDTYEVISADGLTTDQVEYTRFENSLYGAPNKNYSNTLGFSLSNNIEAKVRDDKSSKEGSKKVMLLNALNFSTGYNIAADSLNLSPVRMSGGTSVLKNKMSINFGATFDPYALDRNNRKIDKLNIDNGGSLVRLTSGNINMSYSLNSETFKSNKEDDSEKRAINESVRSGGRADDLFGKPQNFADRMLTGSEETKENNNSFYNYKIPWSLRLAYAVNYSNTQRQNEIASHSLMFSGDIEFSPRWTVGASSGYDFKNQGFTYTQLRFERDLLSWRMNFSWIPFSSRSSWNFFIGIKSSLLKDLKYDKRKQADKTL